jgi:hypothetical protein
MTTILLLAAVVCFGLATLGVGAKRVNVAALGLFCWALSVLLPRLSG